MSSAGRRKLPQGRKKVRNERRNDSLRSFIFQMKNCPKNGHETREMFVRFMMQTGVDSVRNLR